MGGLPGEGEREEDGEDGAERHRSRLAGRILRSLILVKPVLEEGDAALHAFVAAFAEAGLHGVHLGLLIRREHGAHFLAHGAAFEQRLEAARAHLIVGLAELGLAGFGILHGRPERLGLGAGRFVIGLEGFLMLLADGLDLRLLIGRESERIGPGSVHRLRWPRGRGLGEDGKGDEQDGEGSHGFLQMPCSVRHAKPVGVEGLYTSKVLRTLDAIVLRPTLLPDGGAVVSFLTEWGERVTGLAKGAKKPSAKWVAAFEPLGAVRVTFFGKEQAELRRVTRCELAFSPITLGHLESSLVIACLADLFDRVAKEGMEDERLYRLLSACGRALKRNPDHALAVLAYSEHWLLHCLGVLPHPRACGRCGGESAPLVLLDERGWACAACTPVDPSEALPQGARDHLKRLRTASAEAILTLDPGDEAQVAVTALLRNRLMAELGGQPKSYEVLFRTL